MLKMPNAHGFSLKSHEWTALNPKPSVLPPFINSSIIILVESYSPSYDPFDRLLMGVGGTQPKPLIFFAVDVTGLTKIP